MTAPSNFSFIPCSCLIPSSFEVQRFKEMHSLEPLLNANMQSHDSGSGVVRQATMPWIKKLLWGRGTLDQLSCNIYLQKDLNKFSGHFEPWVFKENVSVSTITFYIFFFFPLCGAIPYTSSCAHAVSIETRPETFLVFILKLIYFLKCIISAIYLGKKVNISFYNSSYVMPLCPSACELMTGCDGWLRDRFGIYSLWVFLSGLNWVCLASISSISKSSVED